MKTPLPTKVVLAAVALVLSPIDAPCQSPLPGASSFQQQIDQPNGGMQRSQASAPVPGNVPPVAGAQTSQYQQLPLTVHEAQARIDQLKMVVATARIKELQDNIYQMCEWLADMAEAHMKIANSLSRYEATRQQADLERKQANKFSHLKNQAQLLKAELLIRQQRIPEALTPLVDIVIAEPRSATGMQAYKRLQQIGFSEEIQRDEPKMQTVVPTDQGSANTVGSEKLDSKVPATIGRSVSVQGYVGEVQPTNKAVIKPAAKIPTVAPPYKPITTVAPVAPVTPTSPVSPIAPVETP